MEEPGQSYAEWDNDKLFHEGIAMFNKQHYFECHEILEALWKRQQDPEKQFTQGLIQISVALYHTEKCNFRGANKLFERGLSRIRPFEPTHLGVQVGLFVSAIENIQILTIDSETSGKTERLAFQAPLMEPR